MSHVYILKPSSLKRKHDWEFAFYSESKSETEDGKGYSALLVRDKTKKKFGIIEFGATSINQTKARALATKIVLDQEYRASLLGSKKDTDWMWKSL